MRYPVNLHHVAHHAIRCIEGNGGEDQVTVTMHLAGPSHGRKPLQVVDGVQDLLDDLVGGLATHLVLVVRKDRIEITFCLAGVADRWHASPT